MQKHPGFLIAIALASLSALAHAGLTWERTEASGDLAPHQKAVRFAFKFKNTGETPIKILEIKRCCGVGVEDLAKTDYSPGEAGQIVVWAYPKSTHHVMERTVDVTTEDGVTTSLNLKAGVADQLVAKPEALIWQRGEKPQAKTVEIEVEGTQHSVSALTTKLAPNAAGFTIMLSTMEPARRFRLTVTPKSIDTPAAATVKISAAGGAAQTHIQISVQ